jgi:hypothetical protein
MRPTRASGRYAKNKSISEYDMASSGDMESNERRKTNEASLVPIPEIEIGRESNNTTMGDIINI